MESSSVPAIVVLPACEWKKITETQQEILDYLKRMPMQATAEVVSPSYITAKEFMAAVRICRSNFDKLVNRGKIITIKKGRKVYVPASEVERYFREVEV